jgi:nuclear cap-binding protein subunit 2
MKALTELLSQGTSNVYWDRKTFASIEDQLAASTKSATVYVGNLGFEVSEDLLHAHFAQAGSIKRVIMGINKNTKQPCGFCFVEYDDVESSRDAVTLLNASKMGDGRVVRVELDPGFRPGRQVSGGQARRTV